METIDDVERTKELLVDSQEFLEELGSYLDDNFRIEGRSVIEWKRYFKVEIPDDINFATLIELSKEIAIKYQQASGFRDRQNIQMSILEQAKFEKYHEAYNEARVSTQQKTGRQLAAESCKVAATLATKHLENAISNQKVVSGFWKKTCDTLTEVRKLVELMSYSLSGDARLQRDINIYTKEK